MVDVLLEYEQIWFLLGTRKIADLVDLPLATDPAVLDIFDVFTEVVMSAQFTDQRGQRDGAGDGSSRAKSAMRE